MCQTINLATSCRNDKLSVRGYSISAPLGVRRLLEPCTRWLVRTFPRGGGNNHHHSQQDKVAHMRDKTRHGGLDLGARHGPLDPVGHELDEPMTKHQDEKGQQQVAEWMEGLKYPMI